MVLEDGCKKEKVVWCYKKRFGLRFWRMGFRSVVFIFCFCDFENFIIFLFFYFGGRGCESV